MKEPSRPRRLLVVDDDVELAETLVKALDKAGHVASSVHNVDDAVASLSNSTPDLVVLDVRMPGWSGLQLSELIKQQFAIPFIFLSGANDDETVQQATALGGDVRRDDARQRISAEARGERQCDAGVPARRLQEAPAGRGNAAIFLPVATSCAEY